MECRQQQRLWPTMTALCPALTPWSHTNKITWTHGRHDVYARIYDDTNSVLLFPYIRDALCITEHT